MRGKLEVPLQLAGVRIQCEHTIAVQVISAALVAVVIRAGVAGPPEGQIRFRVIGSRHPNAGAAVHPRIPSPGFVARLAFSWNRIKAPDFLAGGRIECRDEAPNTKLGARHAGNHFVFNDQRRVRHRVTLSCFGDFVIPQQFPIASIYGHDMRVDRHHVERIAQNRHAAIHTPAARPGLGRRRIGIEPLQFPSGRIHCHDVIGCLC